MISIADDDRQGMPLDLAGYREADRRIRLAAERGQSKLSLRYLRTGVLPPSLATLTGLRELDLAANDLAEVPEFVAGLENLEALNLAHNRLRDLPPALGRLKKLNLLDLGRNRFTRVPAPVMELSRLEVLNVAHNRLDELPPALAGLDLLRDLSIEGNEGLVNPPPEVLVHGAAAIRAYLRGRRDREQKQAAPATRVFLSYGRPDHELVANLYARLEGSGVVPWMDTRNISGGEDWDWAIQGAIRGSDFFLPCLSANSVERRGYLRQEFHLALERRRELLESDIYIVPLKLSPCDLPAELERYQAIELFAAEGYDRLLAAMTEGLARRRGERRERTNGGGPVMPRRSETQPR